MSLPASITGAHAKKQGEDLSDNDGDEDEGIFHAEQRWCMSFCSFFHFCTTTFFSQPSVFCFSLKIQTSNSLIGACVCAHVCVCRGLFISI